MTWPTDRPGDEVRELAIELALPLDVAERVLAYGKTERRAGYDTALTEVEQGVALPATICNRIDAAVQAEREACAALIDRPLSPHGLGGLTPEEAEEIGILQRAARAIRARGPTHALAEALAQARRETWEKAAEIAKAHTKAPGQRNMKDQWRESVGAEIATAISAAAGEEGK